jgi:plasmid stabilization system protein ParE
MELRWTEEAVTDLERITDYLFEKTPGHAPELARAIYNAPTALLRFPQWALGQETGHARTRACSAAVPHGLPYQRRCNSHRSYPTRSAEVALNDNASPCTFVVYFMLQSKPMMETTLSAKNQIVIPREARKALRLKPGDKERQSWD